MRFIKIVNNWYFDDRFRDGAYLPYEFQSTEIIRVEDLHKVFVYKNGTKETEVPVLCYEWYNRITNRNLCFYEKFASHFLMNEALGRILKTLNGD